MDEILAKDRRREASLARKGTVCSYCWLRWFERMHDITRCGDVWRDPDSSSGTAVCMCGCVRHDGVSATAYTPPVGAADEGVSES
jgi:hypothetical protein